MIPSTTPIFVSDDGEPRVVEGESRPCQTLAVALATAAPSHHILMTAGTYTESYVLSCSGAENAEIVIEALDGAVFDPARPLVGARARHLTPDESDFAALSLIDVHHLILKKLRFRRSWPTAIFARGLAHVRLEDCQATEGQHFLYMRRSRNRERTPCRDVSLKRCMWTQDPDHKIWEGIVTWDEIKDKNNVLSAYNGGFVGAYSFAERLLISECVISHAFNGIRMDVAEDTSGHANRNVKIDLCRFDHIRDNAIEPEGRIEGWWLTRCSLVNVHAPLSVDAVAGHGFYVAGNQMLLVDRPAENAFGSVWKLRHNRPVLDVICVHNSIVMAKKYAKANPLGTPEEFEVGWFDGLCHGANALVSVDASRGLFDDSIAWRADHEFLNDVATDTDFPDVYRDRDGLRVEGANETDFLVWAPAVPPYIARLEPAGRIAPNAGLSRLTPPDIEFKIGTGLTLRLRSRRLVGALQHDGSPYNIYHALEQSAFS